MKKFYLFCFVLLFISCNNNYDEFEYEIVEIEKKYPPSLEIYSMNDSIPNEILELFNQKTYLINSAEQLLNNPLFNYYPFIVREELLRCDFELYSLIITSNSTLNEVTDTEYNFYYNILESEYQLSLIIYTKASTEPIENIFTILNIFSIKKIPDGSKISLNRSVIKK